MQWMWNFLKLCVCHMILYVIYTTVCTILHTSIYTVSNCAHQWERFIWRLIFVTVVDSIWYAISLISHMFIVSTVYSAIPSHCYTLVGDTPGLLGVPNTHILKSWAGEQSQSHRHMNVCVSTWWLNNAHSFNIQVFIGPNNVNYC